MVHTSQHVLPGQPVSGLPEDGAVKIGFGLEMLGENVVSTAAGLVCSRAPRKFWVNAATKRYMPAVNDTVIGIVTDKSADSYKLHIGGSCPGNLSALAFDGATKRNKPNLAVGALVFGRVESADRDLDPEITCKATGEMGHKKDWVTGQGMFGELKLGTVVEVAPAYCRRLLNPTCAVLSSLAAALPFEVAIGMNGCVWVNSGSPKHTIVITTAITHAQHVSDDDVPSVVRRLLEHAG